MSDTINPETGRIRAKYSITVEAHQNANEPVAAEAAPSDPRVLKTHYDPPPRIEWNQFPPSVPSAAAQATQAQVQQNDVAWDYAPSRHDQTVYSTDGKECGLYKVDNVADDVAILRVFELVGWKERSDDAAKEYVPAGMVRLVNGKVELNTQVNAGDGTHMTVEVDFPASFQVKDVNLHSRHEGANPVYAMTRALAENGDKSAKEMTDILQGFETDPKVSANAPRELVVTREVKEHSKSLAAA